MRGEISQLSPRKLSLQIVSKINKQTGMWPLPEKLSNFPGRGLEGNIAHKYLGGCLLFLNLLFFAGNLSSPVHRQKRSKDDKDIFSCTIYHTNRYLKFNMCSVVWVNIDVFLKIPNLMHYTSWLFQKFSAVTGDYPQCNSSGVLEKKEDTHEWNLTH